MNLSVDFSTPTHLAWCCREHTQQLQEGKGSYNVKFMKDDIHLAQTLYLDPFNSPLQIGQTKFLPGFLVSVSLSVSESESLLLSELDELESLALPPEPRLSSRVVMPLSGVAQVTVFRGNSRNSLLLYGLKELHLVENKY